MRLCHDHITRKQGRLWVLYYTITFAVDAHAPYMHSTSVNPCGSQLQGNIYVYSFHYTQHVTQMLI